MRANSLKPHEQAPYVAEAFRLLTTDEQMTFVRSAFVHALIVLEAPGAADFATRERWCSRDGVADAIKAYPRSVWLQAPHPVSLEWLSSNVQPPNVQAADSLASICLNAIKRGHVIERDRLHIPLLQASIVGFVPDHASRAAKKPRPRLPHCLLGPIGEALKANPDGNWKEIAGWLVGRDSATVTKWDDCRVEYLDADDSKASIAVATFRDLITKARKKVPR